MPDTTEDDSASGCSGSSNEPCDSQVVRAKEGDFQEAIQIHMEQLQKQNTTLLELNNVVGKKGIGEPKFSRISTNDTHLNKSQSQPTRWNVHV